MKLTTTLLCSIIGYTAIAQQQSETGQPPAWAKEVIWYEIFVDRFHNGDPSNDPKPHNIHIDKYAPAPPGWSVTPWTSDWYDKEDWAKKLEQPINQTIIHRRLGGDLQGVIEKLDYLQTLGITALFINPINDAPSAHKYDARNYHHIDVNFGPDPMGDNKIMASENPNDPTTWQWTSADKLFLKLIEEVHKRKMKIIIDYSWNHTGSMFWAWKDVIKNQEKSVYKDWYDIKSFDDPSTPENEFAYTGWAGVPTLPEIRKINITGTRVSGHPYEGDINEGAKKHVLAVTKRWVAPHDQVSEGVDGFRLDVADQVGLIFWRDFRTYVKSLNPNAYLIGEIWWQKWPDQLMNPAPYTHGDIFDAVMFYQVYKPARYFFAKTNFEITASQFRDSLQFQWNRLSEPARYAMMNVSSTPDAPRLLTDFYNTNQYKVSAKPHEDPSYKTGKPDSETYQRLRLYLVHLFTTIGAPQIYYGEEAGMWGADDPDDRKPLWWKEFSFQGESRKTADGKLAYDPVGFNQEHFDFYKKLIEMRKQNSVFATGKIEFLKAEGKFLAYKRYDDKREIIVIFNLDSEEKSLSLSKDKKYTDLLTGTVITGNTIALKSLTTVVLRAK